MIPQKQRIAIATACGWTADSWCLTPSGWVFADAVPDYLNDLNACHEMEEVLTGYQQTVTYSDNLMKIVGYHTFDSAHATAAQRSEAFLRTLGLWEKDANTPESVSSTSPATEDSSVTLSESFRDGTTYTRSYQVFLPTPNPNPNPAQPNK